MRVGLGLLLLCACGDVATTLDPTLRPIELTPEMVTPPPEPMKPNPFNPLATTCLEVSRKVTLPDATVGCAPSKTDVTITNQCDFEVRLSSTRSGAFGFASLPSSLAPRASGIATLGFLPTSVGHTEAPVTLRARADGHEQDSSLLVEGTGTATRRVSFDAVSPLAPRVDLLLIIDDDGLFEPELNFAFLARYLASVQNARVVVSNLTGEIQRPDGVSVLMPDSPAFIDRFVRATRVSRTEGVRSCHETALRLKTLREPAGFWSEASPQAVVCITNEVDQSEVSGSAMRARWEGRLGLPTTSFSLIAPFLPRQCGESDARIEQLVQITNGLREELCTRNWSSVFQSQLASLGYATVVQLPARPTLRSPQTLEVSVGGVGVPATRGGGTVWKHDGVTGAIRFEPLYAPEPGSSIRATWETCDAP